MTNVLRKIFKKHHQITDTMYLLVTFVTSFQTEKKKLNKTDNNDILVTFSRKRYDLRLVLVIKLRNFVFKEKQYSRFTFDVLQSKKKMYNNIV